MAKASFPKWIRRSWPSGRSLEEVKDLLGDLELHTVCQSAHCPNQAECWARRTATFMVLGNVCTRDCRFCAVNSGLPAPPDPEEPRRVAEAVRRLALRHVVITSVTRDDVPDGGAGHFARTIAAIRAVNHGTTIEALVPDFSVDYAAIAQVIEAGPEVFGHNIETVERLHPVLRDRRYSYEGSIEVLRIAAALAPERFVKSAFMLGCGEKESEVRRTLEDLCAAGCTVVAMGQYLQPTPGHARVAAYVHPEQFAAYEAMAYEMGFAFAVAGPFVRSSYRSEDVLHGLAALSGAEPEQERAGHAL